MTEKLIARWARQLVRLFRLAADVAELAACVGLRGLTRVLCCLGLPRCFYDGWRVETRKYPGNAFQQRRLTLLYGGYTLKYLVSLVRLRLGAVRFWWLWLRLVHKHGWEKAVVDVKCRFWGFKFLPNV